MPNSPAELIRQELAAKGVLPFDRFMELALYAPGTGYYEARKTPGRHGDFYTSVSVGELFGQLLACQFSLWLETVQNEGGRWRIVEAGAHDGRLAKDILTWLQANRPELFDRIEYCLLEPSTNRRQWQKETLAEFQNKTRWFAGVSELINPRSAVHDSQSTRGIIFSNELLDAMPVRRFGWDAAKKEWFEWGVALEGEKFVWAKIRPSETKGQKQEWGSPSSVFRLSSSLLNVLPDNYTIETSPAAEAWWRAAATALARGWLVTFDYGLTHDELFSPARPHGTLRAYSRHHASADPLACPGEQDLTAHVNFSAIQQIGLDTGLHTEFFGPQAKFLTKILAAAVTNRAFADWSRKSARQFQTLTHPEHLGHAFRVLVQKR